MHNIFLYLHYFISPLPNKTPFFSNRDQLTYKKLYSFRNIVKEWSFSVSAFDKYLQLMQKTRTAPFLLMLNVKHVMSIELHHKSFIMITVDCNNQDWLHSVVINPEIPGAQFNIIGLLNIIHNIPCEPICSNLKSIQWKQDNKSDLPPSTLY
jgi:hypothetical protein